ncbi:MAG: hypothetical protein PHS62_02295 [Patescibacteria group bacterium]|nr:hypothetical protein [Patescibacteria group bacterium]
MNTKLSNRNLHKASQAKKDEFYTQLVDAIELSLGNKKKSSTRETLKHNENFF